MHSKQAIMGIQSRRWLFTFGLLLCLNHSQVCQAQRNGPVRDQLQGAVDRARAAVTNQPGIVDLPNNTFRDNAPPPAYDLARSRLDQGDCAGAISLLRAIVTESAASPLRFQLGEIPVRTLLGECHLENNDLVAAAQQYRRAMQVAAEQPGFLRWVPWLLVESSLGAERQQRTQAGPAVTSITADLSTARPAQLPRFLPTGTRLEDGNRGLDVFETMRMLALAAYRTRWLMGRDWAVQDDLPEQVLTASVHPGAVGTEPEFRGSASLITAMRRVLQHLAGDDQLAEETELACMLGPRSHPISAVALLARMRCQSLQWNQTPAERSPVGLTRYIVLANWASEAALHDGQFRLATESLRLATEELDRYQTTCDQPTESQQQTVEMLFAQLERRTTTLCEQFRREAPALSIEMRLLSAQLARGAGDFQRAGGHLRWVQNQLGAGRSIPPRLAMKANAEQWRWLHAAMIAASDLSAGHETAERRLTPLRIRCRAAEQTLAQQINRSICHPVAFRGIALSEQIREMPPTDDERLIASQLRRLLRATHPSATHDELSSLDHVCMLYDRREAHWLESMRLADRLQLSEQLVWTLDDLLAHRARVGQARTPHPAQPMTTDLQWLLRQSSRAAFDLNKTLAGSSRLQRDLSAFQPAIHWSYSLEGPSVEVRRQRLQARLAELTVEHFGRVPRCVPPTCDPTTTLAPQQPANEVINANREIRRGFGRGIAVLTMTVVPSWDVNASESILVTLTTSQQTTHWIVPGVGRVRERLREWLQLVGHPYPNRPQVATRLNQATLDLHDLLFPRLCGMQTVVKDLTHLIVVPDDVLWFLPMEEMPMVDSVVQRDRWGDHLHVSYSPTPGYAFGLARELTKKPLRQQANVDADPDGFRLPVAYLNLTANRDDDETAQWLSGAKLIDQQTWQATGTPAWWGQSFGHVVVREHTTETDRLRPEPTSRWRQELSLNIDRSPHSVLAISPTDSAGASEDLVWYSPAGGRNLFQQSCLLHASGAPHVVLHRWPLRESIARQWLEDWASEAPLCPFPEAFGRAKAILGRQKFVWNGWRNPVRSNGQDTTIGGDAPIIAGAFIHSRAAEQP